MKIFEKKKYSDNKREIYFCGLKVFSYRKNFKTKYDEIYAKRFFGLTEFEKRYILECQFEKMTGYKLNLDNPQSFNEKIQWYKLYYQDPLMIKCADKVGVRDYVKEKLGEEYLIPCLGIYNTPDEIDFDSLPNQFVMKVNWGSGQNIIVKDKSKLNIKKAKEQLKNWLKPNSNHYYNFLEWAYKDIEPKIIIEKFINEIEDVKDYKFFCYNSNPLNMILVQNRALGKDKMTINFFDKDFNSLLCKRLYKMKKDNIKKPVLWNEMLEKAKLLSKPFPFVRVDFYMIKDKLKVGELTFYPGNGTEPFEPVEWDYKFGKDFDINSIEFKGKDGIL